MSDPLSSPEGAQIDVGSAIASAKECLATYLSGVSEQSSGENHALRKSYWRIMRAQKHLTKFEASIPVAAVVAAAPPQAATASGAPYNPDLITVKVEDMYERMALSAASYNSTQSQGIPAPASVWSNIPHAIPSSAMDIDVSRIGDRFNFSRITPSISSAGALSNLQPAINDPSATFSLADFYVTAPVSLPIGVTVPVITAAPVYAVTTAAPLYAPVTVPVIPYIAPVIHAMAPVVAPAVLPPVIPVVPVIAPVIVPIVVPEDPKVKHAAETLIEYTNKIGSIHQDSHFHQWLELEKGYWSALRRPLKIAREAVVREALIAQQEAIKEALKEIPLQPPQQQQEIPSINTLGYADRSRIDSNTNLLAQHTQFDCQGNRIFPEVDLHSERMHMSGFAGIAKKLPLMHPAEVNMALWGVDNFEQWPSLLVTTNPSYSYEDNPLPGWSKNICVRMGGKSQGSLEVTYSPPDRTRRLRSKLEVQAYAMRYNLSSSLSSRFDFRSVFCVCHTPEDDGNYLECSFGRAGCNRWLHPECVGLGKRKEGQLRDMATVICPLCTVYLESIGATHYLKDKL